MDRCGRQYWARTTESTGSILESVRVLENLRSFREEFVTQFGDRGCSSCCSLAIGKRASERDRVSDPEGYDFQEL